MIRNRKSKTLLLCILIDSLKGHKLYIKYSFSGGYTGVKFVLSDSISDSPVNMFSKNSIKVMHNLNRIRAKFFN